MTLSFSLNPRSSPTPTNPNPPNPNFISEEEQEDDQQQVQEQEFITEFTPSPSPPPPPPHFTIPPIPNTWNPHPLSSPSVSGEEMMDSEAKLLKKLREDLAKLPDPSGAEEFRNVPVEGYGRAVLEGYGWREGAWIGRNAKGDVEVKKYTGNVGRHGLGFVPRN